MEINIIAVSITALASVLGTLYVAQLKRDDENIISQRKSWRDYLREWTIKFSEEYLCKADVNKLEKMRNELHVRINPHRDEKLIGKVDNVIADINNNLTKKTEIKIEELNTITYMISLLLKHDWDRVKIDNSFFGRFIPLNVLILLTTMICSIIYFTGTEVISEYGKGLSFISFLFHFKLIIGELSKYREVREVLNSNIFQEID